MYLLVRSSSQLSASVPGMRKTAGRRGGPGTQRTFNSRQCAMTASWQYKSCQYSNWKSISWQNISCCTKANSAGAESPSAALLKLTKAITESAESLSVDSTSAAVLKLTVQQLKVYQLTANQLHNKGCYCIGWKTLSWQHISCSTKVFRTAAESPPADSKSAAVQQLTVPTYVSWQ